MDDKNKDKVVPLVSVTKALTDSLIAVAEEIKAKEHREAILAEARVYHNILTAYMEVGFEREEAMYFISRALDARELMGD